MNFVRTLLLSAFALSAFAWSGVSEACGGAQCICSDMRAFDPLANDPTDFSRLDFGYAVHDLEVGLTNFITELGNWSGAGTSAVARAARELKSEVLTLKDCFCGRPSYDFLIRGTRGVDTFYAELARTYDADTLINGNSHLQVRMRRIEAAYATLSGN